jgi:hypothetical protein
MRPIEKLDELPGKRINSRGTAAHHSTNGRHLVFFFDDDTFLLVQGQFLPPATLGIARSTGDLAEDLLLGLITNEEYDAVVRSNADQQREAELAELARLLAKYGDGSKPSGKRDPGTS